MEKSFSENPIIISLMPEAKREVAKDLTRCYFQAKKLLPEKDFEKLMADMFEDIDAYHKLCNPGTSYVSAGLLLCLPYEDHELIIEGITREEEEQTNMFVKAALAWKLQQDHKIRMS